MSALVWLFNVFMYMAPCKYQTHNSIIMVNLTSIANLSHAKIPKVYSFDPDIKSQFLMWMSSKSPVQKIFEITHNVPKYHQISVF